MAQHVGDGSATDAGRVAGSADHRDRAWFDQWSEDWRKRGASMSCCEWFADMGSPDPFVCGRHDNLLAGERAAGRHHGSAQRPVGQGSESVSPVPSNAVYLAGQRAAVAVQQRHVGLGQLPLAGLAAELGHRLDDPGTSRTSPDARRTARHRWCSPPTRRRARCVRPGRMGRPRPWRRIPGPRGTAGC